MTNDKEICELKTLVGELESTRFHLTEINNIYKKRLMQIGRMSDADAAVVARQALIDAKPLENSLKNKHWNNNKHRGN